ncbi:leucine rich repeat protein bspa family [Entamoeba histolytica]|nr:leucine rich repeat protein bspa family [Entamoeba histolytica]
MKTKLSLFEMVIVGSYFHSKKDFIKLTMVCTKYNKILTFYHYNPIAITQGMEKFFPNIHTQHHYHRDDVVLNVGFHLCEYEMSIDEYNEIQKRSGEWKCLQVKNREGYLKPSEFHVVNIIDQNLLLEERHVKFDFSIVREIRDGFHFPMRTKEVVLSTQLKTLPDRCFMNCFALKEIDLKNIQKIGDNCFSMCSQLTSLTISSFLTEIGRDSFKMCDSIQHISNTGNKIIPTRMDYQLSQVFEEAGIIITEKRMSKVDIQQNDWKLCSGCVEIGDGSFETSTIESIDLSEVEKIGNHCFFCCNNLSKVIFSDKITSIGEWSFCECPRLSIIEYNSQTPLKTQIPHFIRALIHNHQKVCSSKDCYCKEDQIQYQGSIPDGVEVIEKNVFMREYSIREINIPSTVTEIKSMAFQYMDSLTSITLSKQLMKLPNYFLRGCRSIELIDTKNVEEISKGCFDDCLELTRIKISNNLHSISPKSFLNCSKLMKIDVQGLQEMKGKIRYKIYSLLKEEGVVCDNCCLIHDDINEEEENFNIQEGVTRIASYCFNSMNIKKISIPKSVRVIEKNAIYNCTIAQMEVSDVNKIEYEKGCFNGTEIQNKTFSEECFNDYDDLYFIEQFNDGMN